MAGTRNENARDDLIKRLRDTEGLRRLVGQDPTFMRSIRCLPIFARGCASVVISGETGTGKELVARALHYIGPRAAFPFVPVNCGSLSDTLLEDEFFGHERGAFTDAKAAREGLLARADGGTLFLDEVDSLTPRGQVALLRVLQDRTFRALGSARERCVDVRFLAATNTPLRGLVADGLFRTDLYYRLAVLTVQLPALRDRPDDVLLLARHFLGRHGDSGRPLEFSPAARLALVAYDWPGNVRELENAVVRAQTLAVGGRIEASDLGLPDHRPRAEPRPSRSAGPIGASPEVAPFQEAKRAAVEAFEFDYLTRLLRSHCGNVSRAARAAGKERNDLRRLLKKHRLEPVLFAPPNTKSGGESPPHSECIPPHVELTASSRRTPGFPSFRGSAPLEGISPTFVARRGAAAA